MPISSAERAELAHHLRAFRRAALRDTLSAFLRPMDGAEPTLPQLAVLLYLDEYGEQSISDLATAVDRSLSATSRLVEQLVRGGLAQRQEDPRDRRTRRVAVTTAGQAVIASMEQVRADAQLAVMATMDEADRATVQRAMRLLAEAARTHREAPRDGSNG